MALPTLDKTWSFWVNNTVNSGVLLTDVRTVLLSIKDKLKLAGWTVQGSSDGATAGHDSVDRWTAIDKLLFAAAGSAHSWIVLSNASITGGTFQVLISCTNSGGSYYYPVRWRISTSGYSGGTTTADPTATVNITLSSSSSDATATNAILGTAANRPVAWHVMASSDLQSTRIFVMMNGVCIDYWAFEKMRNPSASMVATDNWVAFCRQSESDSSTGRPLIATFSDVNTYGRGWVAATSTARAPYMTCECIADEPLADVIMCTNPEENDEWTLSPVGVLSLAGTTTSYGRIGELYDIWWGSVGMLPGQTLPADTSRDFICMGDLIFPWDGLSRPAIGQG